MKITTDKIRVWMENELISSCADYDDCGELNSTLLAENCAAELDLYEGDDCTIPEEVFDMAASEEILDCFEENK